MLSLVMLSEGGDKRPEIAGVIDPEKT